MRLVEIELKYHNEQVLAYEAEQYAQVLQYCINRKKYEVMLLGPARPPVYKIQKTFSMKIYLKGSSQLQLNSLYKGIDKKQFVSSIFFVPNPVGL